LTTTPTTPNTPDELFKLNNTEDDDKSNDLSPEMQRCVDGIMELTPNGQLNIIRGTLSTQIKFHNYVIESEDFNNMDFPVQRMWIEDYTKLMTCYNLMKGV